MSAYRDQQGFGGFGDEETPEAAAARMVRRRHGVLARSGATGNKGDEGETAQQ
jgi:hypothetical protein